MKTVIDREKWKNEMQYINNWEKSAYIKRSHIAQLHVFIAPTNNAMSSAWHHLMQHFTLLNKTRTESLHYLYRADIGLILVIFKAEISVSYRDGLMSDCAMCEIKAAGGCRGAVGVVAFFFFFAGWQGVDIQDSVVAFGSWSLCVSPIELRGPEPYRGAPAGGWGGAGVGLQGGNLYRVAQAGDVQLSGMANMHKC